MPPWERLLENVDCEGGDGCWLWSGSSDHFGYGQIQAYGRTWRTHRLSWHLYCGPIPEGLQVLHHCDVPACVNPRHLFLGTQRDNIQDCIAKGRFVGGQYKLTRTEVLEIREANGLQRQIAEEYGVDQSTISMIKAGKTRR